MEPNNPCKNTTGVVAVVAVVLAADSDGVNSSVHSKHTTSMSLDDDEVFAVATASDDKVLQCSDPGRDLFLLLLVPANVDVLKLRANDDDDDNDGDDGVVTLTEKASTNCIDTAGRQIVAIDTAAAAAATKDIPMNESTI